MSSIKDIEEYVSYTSTVSLPDDQIDGTTTWSGEDKPLNNYFNENYMSYLRDLLKGKKTYLVSIVMLLYALVFVGWQQGDWNQASELVLGALGLGALRNGIK